MIRLPAAMTVKGPPDLRVLARMWPAAAAVCLTVLTWPVRTVEVGAGLDPSWRVAIHMVAAGRADASWLAFTYGPLGFLDVPLNAEPGLLLPAMVWALLVQFLLSLLSIDVARRTLGPWAAVPATFAMLILLGSESQLPALALLALCLVVLHSADRVWSAVWPLVVGFIGGAAILIKFNEGLVTLGVAALGVALVGRAPLRDFSAFLGGAVLGVVLGWWVVDGMLGPPMEWWRNSLAVAAGYSSGMSFPTMSSVLLGIYAAMLALLVAGALRALRGMPGRRQAVWLLAVGGYVAVSFKQGFVRQDPAHVLVAFTSLLVVLTCVPWVRYSRRVGNLAFALAFVIGLLVASGSESFATRVDPVPRVVSLWDQVRLAVDGEAAAEAREVGRQRLRDELELSPVIQRAISGSTVHVTPYETGAVWALDVRWAPLPTLQDYVAYTPHLDDLNAGVLRTPSGPDVVLAQDLPRMDSHLRQGEGPAQHLALRCAYREVMRSGPWHVLRKAEWSCSPERLLARVRPVDGTVPIPRAGPDDFVIARIVTRDSWSQALRTLLYRRDPAGLRLDGAFFSMPVPVLAQGVIVRAPDCQGLEDPDSTCSAEVLAVSDPRAYEVEFLAVALDRSSTRR